MMKKLKSIPFIVLLLLCSSLSASFWEPPQIISGSNVTQDVDLACDANGNVVAVWIENDNVMSAYRPFGGLWEAPIQLSTGKTNIEPKVCIDGNGTLTAVWINTDGKAIESAHRLLGGSWTPDKVGESGSDYEQLSIDCIGSGRVIAVWLNRTAPNSIAAAWRENDFTWAAANKLADGAGIDTKSFPTVQFTPNNKATVVYFNDNDLKMYYTQDTFGGTWPAVTSFTPVLTDYGKFDFALNDSGQGVVVINEGPGGGAPREVETQLFVNGVPHTTPLTQVSTGGVSNNTLPTVAIDNNGVATVVWGHDSDLRIRSAVTTVTTTPSNIWQTAIVSPGSPDPGDILPKIAASPNGGLVLLWFSTLTSSFDATVKTGFGGGFEPTPVPLSVSTKVGAVCVSNNGTAFAAWILSQGGQSFIEASRTIAGDSLIQGLQGQKRVVFQRGILH